MIDRVRDWGNIFTGNTGRSIAEALSTIGYVELLTSNAQHADQLLAMRNIGVSLFRSHAELRTQLAQRVCSESFDAVFMTAAVADYQPAGVFSVEQRTPMADGCETWVVRNVSAGKVKSHFEQIAVAGSRTEKLIDLFRREWSYRGLLVKFKLEVGIGEDELIAVAEASRRASGADYIVANTLDMVTGENAGAWLLGESGKERVPRHELSARLLKLVKR
jgi:phosphopantothenoylcysteine synthetase/decarboxylase